jgi:hypothetical protein
VTGVTYRDAPTIPALHGTAPLDDIAGYVTRRHAVTHRSNAV